MNYKHGLKNKNKKCLICGKEFIAKKDCLTRRQVYCSRSCYGESLKGKKPTENQLEGLKAGRYKGKKIGGWKWEEKSKRKLSFSKKNKPLPEYHKLALRKPKLKARGILNHNWQGGQSTYRNIVRHRFEYKNWRRIIFEKDDYTCQMCGQKGGKLNAHHKVQWKEDINKRYEIENGITFCEDCHRELHKNATTRT